MGKARARQASPAARAGTSAAEARLAQMLELLRKSPQDPRLMNNIAVSLRALGRKDEALGFLDRAFALAPGDPDVAHNLGNALGDAGRDEDAVDAYRRALAARPAAPRTAVQLAGILQRLGRKAEALRVTADALAMGGHGDATLHNAHGALLFELRRPEAALAHLRIALRIDPGLRAARANAGLAANALGMHEEIAVAAREVLAREPDCHASHAQLAQALVSLGRLDEARPHVDAALAAAPDDLEAQMARSRLLFLAGEWKEAWPAYEARWRRPDNPPPRTRLPRWQGEDISQEAIFVHCEQGLGDTINFCRYLAPLAARARRVRFGCQEPLVPLLRASFPEVEVAPHAQGPGDCTRIVPLLDLPMRLGMADPWWPGSPYLRADGPPPLSWPQDGRLAVGVAWAGNPDHGNDRFRSIAAERLIFLAADPRVRLVSLQRNAPREVLERIDAAGLVVDAGERLHGFADTAALVARLDLVVAVDTSVAHLAGAMGRPAWVLLPAAPDWRWGIGSALTPWYPSMRLFRQRRTGDWAEPLAELATAYGSLLASRNGPHA